MKNIEETKSEILYILDTHCHGGYNYLPSPKGKFISKKYINCAEREKDYNCSACAKCPFGERIAVLGESMKTDVERKADEEFMNIRGNQPKDVTKRKRLRWTPKEDRIVAHMMLQKEDVEAIYNYLVENSLITREKKEVARRMRFMLKSESGNYTQRNVWTNQRTIAFQMHLDSDKPLTSFKRGGLSLLALYEKELELEKLKQKEEN